MTVLFVMCRGNTVKLERVMKQEEKVRKGQGSLKVVNLHREDHPEFLLFTFLLMQIHTKHQRNVSRLYKPPNVCQDLS